MQPIVTYIVLFAVIIIIGQIFNKSVVPITLILVITGMILSLIPNFPTITLNSDLVLDIFLPILVYEISSFSSWIDVKKNIRPITLLSIGHVLFITLLVAWVIHTLIPELGWPLAFVLGAVISPPDDVAIVSIAEKIRLPDRIITILKGEGLFNDATALILFRFALIATITHHFNPMGAILNFLLIVIGETCYGFVLGHLLGKLRVKLSNTTLNMMTSLLTPFIAYIPCIMLGGCGVLATVIAGFIIGNRYSMRFTPEYRLVSHAVWPTLSFGINCILFLLVGLDMKSILNNISLISLGSLTIYSTAVILTVILGRFFWVYIGVALLPRFLFPFIAKKDPYPPWQYPFIISWAGMRGGISLAAALAVPILPHSVEGANPRDFLIFLVFCVIAATFLVQGLTLPWIIKFIGVQQVGKKEEYNEHVSELLARKKMALAVLHWLKKYQEEVKDDPKMVEQVKLSTQEYRMIKINLKNRIIDHHEPSKHDEIAESMKVDALLSQIIEIERTILIDLWHREKISFAVKNKLLDKLDHRVKYLPG